MEGPFRPSNNIWTQENEMQIKKCRNYGSKCDKGQKTTFWGLKRKMAVTTKISTLQPNVIRQNAHHALQNQCRKY